MYRTIVALAFAALTAPVFADDSISEFPAGGLMFKDAADIAITREDLQLAPDKVTVHYEYRSDAKGKMHETLVFPMPPVPIDGSASELGGDQTLADPTNYMNFSARANGSKVKLQRHGYAWFRGTDVTAELKADGIPAYLAYEDIETIMAKVKPAVGDDLVKRGLIARNDDGSYGEPQWLYQSVFEWQQDFAPRTTKVDIAYTPLTGAPGDFGDTYETDADHTYCVGQRQLDTIAKYRAKDVGYEILTLGYITTTAKYWKGPIGQFNLSIDKQPLSPADQLVGTEISFCNMPAMSETPTGFTWSAKDYAPDKDINIVFYGFYDPNAPIPDSSEAQ